MGWSEFVADHALTDLPAVLHELVFQGRDATASLTVYDGRDSGGRKVSTFYVDSADSSKVIQFEPGLHCPNGIYVDCHGDIEEVLVVWSPLAE